jgi:ubiquinone/menaquinone biosynthesis C-methylase UbiE
MAWYDLFASFYDASLEALYAQARRDAVEDLRLHPSDVVLDLPCGTGLSFDVLAPPVGPSGRVVGIDRSAGMLAKARKRAEEHGWEQVVTAQLDVQELQPSSLRELVNRDDCDAILVFLGLTAFDRWEEGFDRLWSVLKPGGRFVIVDVFAERPGLQGRMVNLVARADIRRHAWEPLERVAEEFDRRVLPARREYGGELYVAAGRRPG